MNKDQQPQEDIDFEKELLSIESEFPMAVTNWNEDDWIAYIKSISQKH